MRDFKHSVGVLVLAYLNDTLSHGQCDRCAVGNLLGGHKEWALVFCTQSHGNDRQQVIALGEREYVDRMSMKPAQVTWFTMDEEKLGMLNAKSFGLSLIRNSGYTVLELARVEAAFEATNLCPYSLVWRKDENMFNGLMAVVDVLADIHGVDLTVREEAKIPFIEKYEGVLKS